MTTSCQRGDYTLSTDPQRLDLGAVHAFLTRSYWSPGISRERVERAAANSRCFGLFHGAQQIGFARVITDTTSFAYLADVYILEAHRGQGLSQWLMETILAHADLQGVRRMLLATKDAHGLYAQFGFTALAHPERLMELRRPVDQATA